MCGLGQAGTLAGLGFGKLARRGLPSNGPLSPALFACYVPSGSQGAGEFFNSVTLPSCASFRSSRPPGPLHSASRTKT